MTANPNMHTIYVNPKLWKRARAKTKPQMNMSQLIRILLLMWLDGKFNDITVVDFTIEDSEQ